MCRAGSQFLLRPRWGRFLLLLRGRAALNPALFSAGLVISLSAPENALCDCGGSVRKKEKEKERVCVCVCVYRRFRGGVFQCFHPSTAFFHRVSLCYYHKRLGRFPRGVSNRCRGYSVLLIHLNARRCCPVTRWVFFFFFFFCFFETDRIVSSRGTIQWVLLIFGHRAVQNIVVDFDCLQ